MARNQNTILLKASQGGHHDEGVADSTIYPGEAVRLAADGKYDPESLSGLLAAGRGLKVAKEAGLIGQTFGVAGPFGTVAAPYVQGDVLFFYSPVPGDHINALVKIGETISVGDYLAVEGGGSGKFVEVSSGADAPYPVALTRLRVHDALQTNLPGTAANDDMGLITGTPGTDAPHLQGVDFGGGATDEKAAFEFVLPPEYRAGSPVSVRVKAGMITTVSDGTATVDVEVWKEDGAGLVGSDICATAAQSINSLTKANKTFTITPTGLVAGDVLIIRLAFIGADVGNVGVMIPEIDNVAVLLGNNVGTGQLEALESSGGSLAAAGLIACRVL